MAIVALTGLPDRQSYTAELDLLFDRGEQLRLLKIDIVHLKSVNERCGHAAGDAIIRAVGARIREAFPDLHAYRTYPVTFSIIAKSNAAIDIHALRAVLAAPVELADSETAGDDALESVSPKIRILDLLTEPGDTERMVQELFRYVSAKKELLPQWEIRIDETLREEALGERTLLTQILTAIERESFEVFFQPIYDVKAGRFLSAEALTRLRSEDGWFVNTDRLFAFAESHRLNRMITQIILRKVCRYLGEHPELPLETVSVNMEPDEIMDPALPETIQRLCEEAGIEPSRLRIEMTERTILSDPAGVSAAMDHLRALGLGFYLDDFGTGYSNLANVLAMNFEIIKIDKSLVRMLNDDPEKKNVQMLTLLLQMLRIRGAKIVAEGPESEVELAFAAVNPIDRIQSYHYSKPLPADEFTAFITEHNL